MTTTPLLNELRAVRERLLAEANGTLGALVDRLQAEKRQSNRPHFEPRRTIRSTGAAKSAEAAAENQTSPHGDR